MAKYKKSMTGEFFSLYSKSGDGWKRRPLEPVDIGQSYLGIEKIEIGKTYFVKVKDRSSIISKEKGIDPVLAVSRSEGALGEQVNVLGAGPDLYTNNIERITPVIAWNIDEFTEEILPDDKALEIQNKRIALYNKLVNLQAKRKQIIDDYDKSFTE